MKKEDNAVKILICSCFIYGFIFFCYNTYEMLFIRNIKEIDTVYLLSNVVMMYIPCKIYNISYKDILKKLYMK